MVTNPSLPPFRPRSIAFAALCSDGEQIGFTAQGLLACLPLPPGDYNTTCNGCEYDGSVLSCECGWTPPPGTPAGVANYTATTLEYSNDTFCSGKQVCCQNWDACSTAILLPFLT